jgi:hypothetical protein
MISLVSQSACELYNRAAYPCMSRNEDF